MRKFLVAFPVLLTVLAVGVILFAGCTENNGNANGGGDGYENGYEISVPDAPQEYAPQASAFELFRQMAANMLGLDSLYMDISNTLYISADGGVLSGGVDSVNQVMEMVVKEVFRSETTDFHRAAHTSIDVLGGATMHAVQSVQHVIGGTIYEYSEAFGRRRVELSDISAEMPDIVAQGMLATYVYDFPETAIRDYTVSSRGGNTQVTLTLDGEALTGLAEFSQFATFADFIEAAIRGIYAGGVINELHIEVGDVIYDLLVDGNGMLLLYRMTADGISMRVNDDIVHMSFAVSITVNSYNDVVIDFPDDLHEWGN